MGSSCFTLLVSVTRMRSNSSMLGAVAGGSNNWKGVPSAMSRIQLGFGPKYQHVAHPARSRLSDRAIASDDPVASPSGFACVNTSTREAPRRSFAIASSVVLVSGLTGASGMLQHRLHVQTCPDTPAHSKPQNATNPAATHSRGVRSFVQRGRLTYSVAPASCAARSGCCERAVARWLPGSICNAC